MKSIFVYEYLTASGSQIEANPPASLLAEGRAMFGAIVADFAAIPDADVLTIPRDDEILFRHNAARADFTLVIAPESDGVLETRCRWVEESGGRLLGPSSLAVRLTGDKFALFAHFSAAGIPTPQTWQINTVPPDRYPIVLKPRDGAGSQATYLLRSAADRNAIGIESSALRMIAQEYVEGVAASVSFLIGPRETIALPPCYQRLSSDGRFHYLGGSCPIDSQLATRAVDLAASAVRSAAGLRGYVGVDLVLGAGSSADRIIEINPRLTTSYVGLRRLARFNIAEMMLRVVSGVPMPELEWHPGPVEFFADGSLTHRGCQNHLLTPHS